MSSYANYNAIGKIILNGPYRPGYLDLTFMYLYVYKKPHPGQ